MARRGITMSEVMATIALLAISAAILLPALGFVQAKTRLLICQHNLRQLALATLTHEDCRKTLPPYSTTPPESKIDGSWWTHLMPFAGEEACHQKIAEASKPSFDGESQLLVLGPSAVGLSDSHFVILRCAADASRTAAPVQIGTTNYLANWYVFGDGAGCFGPPQRFDTIHDPRSATILFAEGYSSCAKLARPALTACAYHNFGITWEGKPSDHASYLPQDYTMFQIHPAVDGSDGCHPWRTQTAHQRMPAALADGGVRLFDPAVDPFVWKQFLKPRDGGPVNPE